MTNLIIFPNATALLKALHWSAGAEGIEVTQPGYNGWNTQDLKKVEQLLRPPTYPPCAAVAACLQSLHTREKKFAHQGEGYRVAPPMLGERSR